MEGLFLHAFVEIVNLKHLIGVFNVFVEIIFVALYDYQFEIWSSL